MVSTRLRRPADALAAVWLPLALFAWWRWPVLSAPAAPAPAVEAWVLFALFVLVHVGAIVVARRLADDLGRSLADWSLAVGLLPPLVGLLSRLSFNPRPRNPYGGVVGQFFAVCTGKRCGRCSRAVPLDSRAGQRCPFCHAYWSAERTVQQ